MTSFPARFLICPRWYISRKSARGVIKEQLAGDYIRSMWRTGVGVAGLAAWLAALGSPLGCPRLPASSVCAPRLRPVKVGLTRATAKLLIDIITFWCISSLTLISPLWSSLATLYFPGLRSREHYEKFDFPAFVALSSGAKHKVLKLTFLNLGQHNLTSNQTLFTKLFPASSQRHHLWLQPSRAKVKSKVTWLSKPVIAIPNYF